MVSRDFMQNALLFTREVRFRKNQMSLYEGFDNLEQTQFAAVEALM